MKSIKPRIDILPASQKELWPELRPLRTMGFVLYGGTAIALRLGHRQSIDFDFFSASPLNKKALHARLSFLTDARTIQEAPDTLSVLTSTGIKISFFGNLTIGRFGIPEVTDDDTMILAAMADLMATKLKTILQRVESKDYLDIAAMLEAGTSLEQGLAIAEQMFAPAFASIPAIKALTYFKGGDLEMLSAETRRILIQASSRINDLPRAIRLSDTLSA